MRCAECKGKGMCGLPRCPIVSRFHAQAALKPASSYQGSSPSIFIGSYGWPDMHGGPLLTNDSDSPPDWLDRNLGIEEIVSIRARTISGRSILPSVADNLQEIARSTIPLDVDVVFEKPVAFSLNFDGTIAPVGFTGPVKKMEVLGNARVERVVDRIISDTDVGAADACKALRGSAIDVYQIANLMTAGLLGKRRTFVPTRWAITAVDDTLSIQLKKEIAHYQQDCLYSCPGRLEVRDDRDLGAPDTLGRGRGGYCAGSGGHDKKGIFPDFRCLLLRKARSV